MAERVVDYRIADAEARHLEAPRTFFIPSRSEREALQPGDLAKLMFEVVDPGESDPSAERMWVEVVERDGDWYVGALTNAPAAITTISLGDRVRFRADQIISVLEEWPLLQKKMFVSRRSHDRDFRPGYVYREVPDNDSDSGWRALVGDETQAEVDDPASILIQPVGFMVDRWPELRPVFQTDPTNGEWRWDDGTESYLPL